jgi:hypothetical protein
LSLLWSEDLQKMTNGARVFFAVLQYTRKHGLQSERGGFVLQVG